jgi:hypothetical protein
MSRGTARLPLQDTNMTLQNILDKKKSGEKITMLTAYDYPRPR